MKRNKMKGLIIVILIIALFAIIAFVGMPGIGLPGIKDIRTGIDIRGGVSTTLYPDLPEGEIATADQLSLAEHIISIRLDSKGIFDRNIALELDKNRILVEIPFTSSDTNPQTAIDEIGKTAYLTFYEVVRSTDEDGNIIFDEDGSIVYEKVGDVIVRGDQIEDSTMQTQDGSPVVTLELDAEATITFQEATSRLYPTEGQIGIYLDDDLIIAPVVNQVITNGSAIIDGQRTAQEASELAATIRAGSLPFKLKAEQINSITPILGEGALVTMVTAGIIAFILVCLFMIINYKLAGVISSIALTGLVLASLVFISAAKISLTLPGMAGIILTIGMGVDANVIIFERIKEELRSGKTLKSSIEVGFKRAFTAILDANVTTLITATVLYVLGTGAVKGFALTLGIGIILSFFTAITASRTMLKACTNFEFAQKKTLYGYKEVTENE